MSIKPINTQSSVRVQRRLDRAYQHVSDMWFPVNEGLLTDIQGRLSRGDYKNDIDLLLKDVRGDFSLFTYCLRELTKVMQEGDQVTIAPTQDLNPVELLRWAGIDTLEKILSVSPVEISAHNFKTCSAERMSRFQENIVSATTSEALAESYKIDPDLAYSAALIRQLGLTLVAWNYESVYSSALASLKVGESLDAAITQRLGFSPAMLALRVVKEWPLPADICDSLFDTLPDEESNAEIDQEVSEISAASTTLIKICEVGEALARANNAQMYPMAKEDWEFARREIESALGPQAIFHIQEMIVENCERFMEFAPHIFRGAMVLDPQMQLRNVVQSELQVANPFLAQCRPFLKTKLEALYAEPADGEIKRKHLVALAREIVPAAGFSRGCVFTIEPASMLLIPQLAIGQATIDQFAPVAYWATRRGESLIEEAFQSASPLVDVLINGGEQVAVSICCVLGGSQRIGVLSLEMSKAVFDADSHQQLIHFKAILQCFNDSLTLQ